MAGTQEGRRGRAVARGELTSSSGDKSEGRRARPATDVVIGLTSRTARRGEADDDAGRDRGVWTREASPPTREISTRLAGHRKQSLGRSVESWSVVLGSAEVRSRSAPRTGPTGKVLPIAQAPSRERDAMGSEWDGGN